MKTLIECGTCGYPLLPEEREELVEIGGKMCKPRKPLTDDHGKALLPQYQVIEQHGRWQLVYNQHQIGNWMRHEFRILKLRHDIELYPDISLIEAQKRFRERVESDNE
jgi:hypothetical protein